MRRGPRPPKAAKASKSWQRQSTPVADDEADAVARARMAAIAGRATGRPAVAEPIQVGPVAEIDPNAAVAEADLADSALSEVVDEHVGDEIVHSEPEPEPEPELVMSDTADTDVAKANSDLDTSGQETDEPLAVVEEAPIEVSVASDELESPVVALDTLPGFPWTARFIGLWAREVRYACPDDLRGAIGHWQRWADTQTPGVPLIEEAAAEFTAMLSAWRECGAGVPGLASDDSVVRQLVEEASDDAALAALLPSALRARSVQTA